MSAWPRLDAERKRFREYLNQLGENVGPEQARLWRNGVYGQRKRLYGDYLWAQDRAMFEHDFEEWKQETGS